MTLPPLRSYPHNSPAVKERLADLHLRLESRVELIKLRVKPHLPAINAKVRAIQVGPGSLAGKIVALWKLADFIAPFTRDAVACKRGCSHCCHIAVALTQAEAKIIGMRIGRAPVNNPAAVDLKKFDYGYHNPCTFLVGGDCSIYESRPLACRVQYNVDADALLCELTPPLPVTVPYLGISEQLVMVLASILVRKSGGEMPTCNDIRAWFPRR